MAGRFAVVLLGASCLASCGDEPRLTETTSRKTVAQETGANLSPSVTVVFQDSRKRHWFGTDEGGLFRYESDKLTQFTSKDGLAGNDVRDIGEDAEGNLLVSTLDGVSKFDGRTFRTLPVLRGSKQAWRLDPKDVWLRGDAGEKGPYRYDGKTLYEVELPKHPPQDKREAEWPKAAGDPYDVYSLTKSRAGHLWFGTLGRGACRYDGATWQWFYDRSVLEHENGGWFGLRSMIEDKQGDFWVCNTASRFTMGAAGKDGFLTFRKKPGIPSDRLPEKRKALWFLSGATDGQGRHWMATYLDGVLMVDGEKVRHIPVTVSGKSVKGRCVYVDRDGTVWFATQDSGVYRWDGERFAKFRG